MNTFDWSDLAFASKKPVRELNAVFISAPRELTSARFTGIVKQYLPLGNILLGLAKEPHVLGLENQTQFQMLQASAVQPIIDKVNASTSQNKIYTLSYFQRELPFILEKITFTKVVLVNGSWYRAFHLRPEYYLLASGRIDVEKISPFANAAEAQAFAKSYQAPAPSARPGDRLSESDMMALASETAKQSFDFGGFQTGVALGRKEGGQYELLLSAFNKVVPYQTFAMHHGAAREQHFSPTNDLNYYDTNHAEVELIVEAGKRGTDLTGTTLFINLLPCPTCARMFTSTGITEFVYREDHSDGYAVRMLEASGKAVRRLVSSA